MADYQQAATSGALLSGSALERGRGAWQLFHELDPALPAAVRQDLAIHIADGNRLLLIARSQDQRRLGFAVVDYLGDAGAIWSATVQEEGSEAALAEARASAAMFI